MRLKGKRILLGVSGSISAYKIPDLIRLLKKDGAEVQVMMSRAAGQFVTPLTLATVSGEKVLTGMFEEAESMLHISSSRKADLILIAPATANMLAKFAYGMADDLISTTVLGADCPVLIAPAMNVKMWQNYLVQDNYHKLLKAGYKFIGPDNGDLACGEFGEGRLASLENILDEVRKNLTKQDLKGKKVLITAGPTREYADPVRFLSNASSGKMALALIKEAYYRGASVEVISTIDYPNLPSVIKLYLVETAKEMSEQVLRLVKSANIFIANAAVADYSFLNPSKQKIKSNSSTLQFFLKKNPDILQQVSNFENKPFIVGFALESSNHLINAKKKFLAKRPDILVLNGVQALNREFSKVTLLSGKSKKMVEELTEMPKTSIAVRIFDQIVKSI